MASLRKDLKRLKTKMSLLDTLCSSLTEWMDTGSVTIAKYPTTHQIALISQTQIGWDQFFMGHMSSDWEQIQGDVILNNGQFRKCHMWSAQIVTTTLQHVILLWEQRNQDVHGKDKQEQQTILMERHKHTISLLLSTKEKCLPRDRYIFPDNPQEILQNKSINELRNWIATRHPVIKASIKKAKRQSQMNTHTLQKWFHPLLIPNVSKNLRWYRNKLLHDPFSKKKRHKPDKNQPRHQQQATLQRPITSYLSLTSKL